MSRPHQVTEAGALMSASSVAVAEAPPPLDDSAALDTAAGRPAKPAAPPAPEHTAEAKHVVRRLSFVVTAVGILAGLLLVYEFSLSGIPAARAQAELLASFKEAVPTTTLDAPSRAPLEGAAVALLRIPSLGLQQVVVEGSSASDLKRGPGHLRATPLPGEYGNSVIEGRRTTYGAPFGAISTLKDGATIQVTTGQGLVTYVVMSIVHVGPGQPDVVAPSRDSRLTLVTSDPAFVATGRLAVIAKLNGRPVDVANRPPLNEDSGELGLAGDPLGLALGLVWLQLFSAAAVIAWRLRRRLPRSILYLFATPVLITLALLTYANLDSLLPGTM